NAQYNLGLIAEREGNVRQAQAAYEAALEIDSRHHPTILNLGRIYRLNDDYAKAIALYERVGQETQGPPDLALLNNLAATYRLAQNYSGPEATLQKILGQGPNNLHAYKTLILLHHAHVTLPFAEPVCHNAN